MKAKITERFSVTYMGQKRVFEKGAIAEGWPAKRAIAAGKAVPFAAVAALEDKVVKPTEFK